MSFLDIPERTVLCFENWSKTTVTAYIWEHFLGLALPRRFMHEAEQCVYIKGHHGREKECMLFDSKASRDVMWRYSEGCLKICHAGYLEWCAPVFHKKKLCAILLAGIRHAPDTLPEEIPIYSTDFRLPSKQIPHAPDTDEEEIRFIFEGLQQVTARIEKWLEKTSDTEHISQELTRDELVRFLIRRDCVHNITLESLGKQLNLSPSRTAHLVKELTGRGFKELVGEYRLDYAARRLRYGDGTAAKVSYECGFENVPHFHRVFRRHFGMTPLEFRKLNRNY